MIPIRSSQNDSELEVADSAAGQDISEYKTEEGGGRTLAGTTAAAPL